MNNKFIFIFATIVVIAFSSVSESLGSSLQELSAGSLGDSLGNRPLPNWSGGRLLTLESAESSNPSFTIYDGKGTGIATSIFSIPQAIRITVYSFSHGTDGVIALVGAATDAGGRSGPFVGWISQDGHTSRVVRTDSYYPKKVAVGADGTIWTAGYEYFPGQSLLDPNAAVLRRWSSQGKLIGSFVKQSGLANAKYSVASSDPLIAGGDRVAWFSSRDGKYFEISLLGVVNEMDGLRIPDRHIVSGMAITDGGDTFLSYQLGVKDWAVARLDRQGRQWEPVESGSGKAILVYGADGDHLVGHHGGLSGDLKYFRLLAQ
jgi:hypothetical protein